MSSNNINDYVTLNPNLDYELNKNTHRLTSVQKYCVKFICQLAQSLHQRLPSNINVLRKIYIISVDQALRHVKPSLATVLEELLYPLAKITDMEM